jgi:hypothetical protein
MKKGKWLVFGLLGLVLAVGLTGCIVSTSPGTEDVIVMNPGETKVFKVSGVNLNSLITKCEWVIDDRRNGNYSLIEGTDHVEFTVSPEGEKSNRVFITCKYYMSIYIDIGNLYPGWVWVLTDSRTWNICIPRNTAPVWQGDYYIADSTDVQMLNGYTEITGTLNISNSNLKRLEGLETLTSVGGGLNIYYNRALTSLTGLDNLSLVGGDLYIDQNTALTNLTGLENLTSVGGNLDIIYNTTLKSLSGFENLTSVGGFLYIDNNDALTSLSGLENLASVGGGMHIEWNAALTLLGMADLQKVGKEFYIFSNPLLCKSLAEELMNQVLAAGGIGGERNIEGNKECTER